MYESIERALLADELSAAIAAGGPWTAPGVAERAAGCLDRWPRWLDSLALRIASNDALRTAPTLHRRLAALITDFLAERPLPPGEPEAPPRIIRLMARSHPRAPGPEALPRPRYVLEHDWPIARIASIAELAELLELSDGQFAWRVEGSQRWIW